MAYLVQRPGGRVQIRESVRTARGPRSRTLVSFTGPLDDAVLGEAVRCASRPLDLAGLVARARALGIGWVSKAGAAARQLIAGLQSGESLDPRIAGLLHEALAQRGTAPIDDALLEAVEWLGRGETERATTLRGLLRLGDAIVQARTVRPSRPRLDYPEIDSGGPEIDSSGRRFDAGEPRPDAGGPATPPASTQATK